MKLFINYIKALPDNDLEFYVAIISLLLSTTAFLLSYNWPDNQIVSFLTWILYFSSLLIIVYIIHFRHVNPFTFSMLLSVIVTLLTGIILFLYLKFKDNTGSSIPIVFVSQLIIANLIKHLLKLN